MPHPIATPPLDNLTQHRRALGRRLRLLRAAQRRSQAELADTAGLSLNTLRTLEQGRAWARLDTLLRLCDTLGVSPADVLGPPTPTNGPTLLTTSLRALCRTLPTDTAHRLSRLFALLADHPAAPRPSPHARRPRS